MGNTTYITDTRATNYPAWYQQIIKAADLAEPSVVRGCMVIKPWGYALWENIQKILDKMIKETGHKNFYCPLFVPLSFMEREASHVKGFAKECAVVTHHRLEMNNDGHLQPKNKLEEPLIIRPTSETIIGDLYSKWIQSYRDLPLLYNQWANVVRWEMRPRLFLRTSEFLWQEGHTAHATEKEAKQETLLMLKTYITLIQDYLAIPSIHGEKTKTERFPGAENTYTIEMMMQDKKALQGGTSHYLGKNFAKAFNIKYLSSTGIEKYVYMTSWGVTTRLIGGMIMMHSDDNGLILPPRIAPIHVMIIPLFKVSNNNEKIMHYCQQLSRELNSVSVKVEIDDKDERPGKKSWNWIKKGIPIRVEIGAKEVETNTVFIGRRDKNYNEKISLQKTIFIKTINNILLEIQKTIYDKALNLQKRHTVEVKSQSDFYEFFKDDKYGGFAIAPWIDESISEMKIKKDLKVTPRVIPESRINDKRTCIFTGKQNAPMTLFAKSY